MMKKVLLLTALLLALPFAAFAGSSIDFTNGGDFLSGTNSGLTLTGSTLIAANGLGGGLITGSNLGTVSFSTGILSAGTLQMGGTFAAGGAFSVGKWYQRIRERRDQPRLVHRAVATRRTRRAEPTTTH